jgi:2-hydroxychromene-2-carboxylate isomerase
MRATGPRLEFWYDFASTYSYLSAMRIEALAASAGVDVVWKPFLLGPIFHAQGWTTSPFNIYPAKGRNMVRDIERLAAERGLAFALPNKFPQNSLLAARLALVGADEGWIAPFTRCVYVAEFADGADISERAALAPILQGLNLDSQKIFPAIEAPDLKDRLKRQTTEAQARGIFGAPSFLVGEELFWGDDRLEQALAWTRRG